MEPRDPVTGPISPELVLVDPDLAARARAVLPEHPWPAPVPIEPSPRPVRRRRIPVAAISGAVGLVLLGLMALRTSDRPTFAAEGEPIPGPAPPATTAPTPAPQRTQPPAANRPPRRRTQPRFRPARTFSWPRKAGAAYYRVTFLRNGRAFYRTRTSAARLELPRRVRFTPGRYRWTVRPAIGGAIATPIVDSTFVVSRD